jgi:threonyl-tRNA synthetase
MRIITLHCDYIKFKATKKAIKEPEPGISNEEQTIKEPLVVLTAVEKGDSVSELLQLIKAVKKTAKEVKASNIVLYPYAHLSSNLSPPNQALEYLKKAESALKKDFKVTRAPFGYYKTFELKCKGHPLAELSKEFSPSAQGDDNIDLKDLLHKMEKVKMSTQKAPKGLKSNVELGRDLDLYIVSEIIGSGLPLFTPKGTTIKREIERFITDEELNRGYLHTSTPLMAKSDLYKVSGHWQHYQDSMFIMNLGSEKYALRPMTCPFQFVLYKRKPRSYKELPIKYAEVATLFRNEQSGELRGLTRVRQFNLADAHIICRPDQVDKEFTEAIDLIKHVMKTLNIEKDIWYRFSKYDPKDKSKYIQNTKAWESSQKMMKKILDKLKIKYVEANGEAAFYGPKLDLQYKDVFEKEDTLLTVQIDFALPERYDMKYKDENNKEQRPMIIHRSSTGATERLIAFLLEKTQGNLPLWLSPVQVRIINFTDRNTKAAEKTLIEIKKFLPSLRIDSDYRSKTVNEKVRDAEMQKIPYIIVIGDKEEKSKTLAVRSRGAKPKFKVKLSSLIKELNDKIEKHY